jgi:hypothetical protein
MKVFDNENVQKQIKNYQIDKQYRKSCQHLEADRLGLVNFKLSRTKTPRYLSK